jgi:hypothetical protein
MSFLSSSIKNVVAAAAAACAFSAMATPVVGIVNLSLGQVLITDGSIDWNNETYNVNPPSNGANVTVGEFNVIPLKTGSFATVPTFSLGTIRDMADPTVLPGDTGNAFPVGVLSNVTNFLSFAARPNWAFTAHMLQPGSIAGTPYSLTQVGANVSVTFSVDGRVCDTGMDLVCNAGDDVTKWTGIFSAQYTNTDIPTMIGTILGGGALDNNGWSATIEASRIVSEPTSLALVGLSLVGVGAVARRRAAKKAA